MSLDLQNASPATGDLPADGSSAHAFIPIALAAVMLVLALVVGGAAMPGLAAACVALALLLVGTAGMLAHRAWRGEIERNVRLHLEREQNQALWSASIDGLHMIDRDGRLVHFSDQFAAMLGIDRTTLDGAHVARWERRYSPTQVDRVLRSFAVGQLLTFPSTYARGDGTLIQVEVKARGVRVGERDLLVLTARDVTDAQRTMRRLRRSESLQSHAARQAGVGAWELDTARREVVLTPEASRMLHLAPDGPGSIRGCLRGVRPEARRPLLRALVATWESGLPMEQFVPWGRADGPPHWFACTAERSAPAGGAARLIGTLRDVTEQLDRADALKEERELLAQLEAQGRARDAMLRERDAMLDVLAHEVRQPLNNASAAMQSALASLRDIGEHAAAPRLKRAQVVLGQVMARLDNTLAAATLLARQGPVGREEMDLDMLLAVVIADMPASDRTRIEVRRESSARAVYVDMGLMRLALRNLLSNALKYSRPDSPVVIRVADSEQPLGLVFDVIDQGTGIEPGLRGHLFERGARGRQTQGAEHGLGLYIVRRVMEMHGGQAQLLHTGSAGTTMRLILAEAAED